MDKIIPALDNMSKTELISFLENSPKPFRVVKIGLENYIRYGAEFVKDIHKSFNTEIFLDLKLHDIPNTVAKSIEALEDLPLKFLTIHLTGGPEMVRAALVAQKKFLPRTTLLGVSYLTSLKVDDFQKIWGIDENQLEIKFQHLLRMGIENGIEGIVLPASKIGILNIIEQDTGRKIIKVTPGIRFQDEIDLGNTQDQADVLSPEAAFSLGSNYLVMGRSLTSATDLSSRLEQIPNKK